MPSTPSINSLVLTETNLAVTVTAGADTSHVQWDRSWVPNVGSNDAEMPLSSGQTYTHNFTPPGTPGDYTISVRARIGSTASSWVSRGITVDAPKPTTFNWNIAKTTGGSYNLSYSEWNALLNKINEWQAYKKKPATTFSRSQTSGALSGITVPRASIFNSAISAIDAMSPSMSTPSFVGSGTKVSASLLNRLRDSLNSLT